MLMCYKEMKTIDRSSTSYLRSLSVISSLLAVRLFPSQTAGICDVTEENASTPSF